MMWKFLRGGATVIPGGTSIPESRVEFCKKSVGLFKTFHSEQLRVLTFTIKTVFWMIFFISFQLRLTSAEKWWKIMYNNAVWVMNGHSDLA